MRLSGGYNSDLFNPRMLREKVIRVARNIEILKRKHVPIECMVARGKSGMGMAFPLSMETGIPVVVARKEDERSHGMPLEGDGNFGTYVIIDDFIDSGDTCKSIVQQITSEHGNTRCIAILLYSDTDDRRGIAADNPGPVIGGHFKCVVDTVSSDATVGQVTLNIPKWHV